MIRIIHWSCSSCDFLNKEASYQDWGLPKERITAVVRSVRSEHNRISLDCKNLQILVRENGQVFHFWELEEMVEGLKT